MSFDRLLTGGCRCRRNQYVVHWDSGSASNVARVFFDQRPSHRLSNASPIATFLRVPLAWYHSTTLPFFPDETNAMIRRAYTSPHEEHTIRCFCGFCGSPLSYWTEEPRTEADYINVTLGTLSSKDLADLEDLGVLPSSDDEAEEAADAAGPATPKDADGAVDEEVVIHNGVDRETVGGLPWFDTLVAGSKLGNMRAAAGRSQSKDGSVRIEWEIVEWTEDDEHAAGKRKHDQVDAPGGDTRMEGVHH